MSKLLKGGTFQNRYVFKAKITATSPLHIGSGEMIDKKDTSGNDFEASGIVVDSNNKPYIPGSSLRGAMRDWLREVWGETERENKALDTALKTLIESVKKNGNDDPDKISKNIANIIKEKKERLELLFGSAFAESKIEVWDARCISNVNTPTNNMLSGWDADRMTYVAKSVAINPETGTAEDKKLYNFELVPEGACFDITLTGQNLSEEDAALILHALDGFKHPTSPLALGSMTKRGFGRFSISEPTVYKLSNSDIGTWKNLCAKDNRAGYYSICREEFKMKEGEVKNLKEKVKCQAKAPTPLKTKWSLSLETPIVVRSGSKFGWRNTEKSKARNYKIQYKWGEQTLDEIADLYFSLKINGNKVEPYYHIPSSSIRGSLREWTIKHLLPEDWWDIEKGLKKHVQGERDYASLPKHLVNILSLFGFVVNTENKTIDEKYTCAGRLTIDVSPFKGNYLIPEVDGTWSSSGNIYGPTNAKRHIKTRNPLDRITNAAKETGLHSGLEFSKGQTITVTLTIEKPTDFDKQLIDCWCNEINNGMIRFGGLTSIGRGRVKMAEAKDVK